MLRHEGDGNRETSVDQGNLLLRGSSVRNTKWVLGLVVNTGKDTKLVQNSREAPSKLSTVEVTVNNMLYLILTAQLALASVSVICYTVWNKVRRSKLDYTCLEAANSENAFYAENCGTAAEPSTLGMWFTFFTLFNNFGAWVGFGGLYSICSCCYSRAVKYSSLSLSSLTTHGTDSPRCYSNSLRNQSLTPPFSLPQCPSRCT